MRKLFAVLVLLALLFSAAPVAAPVAAQEGPDRKAARTTGPQNAYIVQLVGPPVVAYDGGIPGLRPTRPRPGQKINPNAADVTRYVSYLTSQHDNLLNRVGGGRKLYSYAYSFNGFAAALREDQAAELRAQPEVLVVTKNEVVRADTSSTPAFLGLTEPGGLWEQLGGVESAGEDVIIGIVDSGIWPEQVSFSDRVDQEGSPAREGRLVYRQIPGWHGRCVPGEGWNASYCNQKLIGAQYFNQGWGGDAALKEALPWEFASARDYNGHGTHTASTAGGNANVATSGPAEIFGRISGIAPRARIAAYKALWHQADGGASGNTTDLVAAIDQAVADGVDVINYSISGSRTNFMDPVMVAFLFAADAGVFVAASAGNNGPATSTVAHPGPWVTTVAAGTHNRDGVGSVTLGSGDSYEGASVASVEVGPAPLVTSDAAVLEGADPDEAALCFPGTLDPEVAGGKIVVCDRGVNARIEKSQAVLEAGGVGMILVNVTPSSVNADFHFVPSVHLPDTARDAVREYASSEGATATIHQATLVYDAPAPYTASFSSRGPLLAGGGDVLKPDVIAPGQDILAAVAPPGNNDRLFDLYSGTSMSSPHVAGLAALLIDLHPDWTPMMVKSALMTSAGDVLDGPNTHPLLIFRQGAGHVRPNAAADPGLVFNAGWNDWLAFLCGTGQLTASYCPEIRIDPSDLNVASIAIGDLAGSQTVTRTLINVSGEAETYAASVEGLGGITVSFNPATFTVEPGQAQEVEITFTRTDAALNAYTGGQITFTGDNEHVVRIPAVVRPVAISAPAEVSGSGASGSVELGVKFGYNGSYEPGVHGLVPAATFDGVVPDDPTDEFVVGGPGILSFDVEVAPGTVFTRFQLFDEYTDGEDDLDLYVYFNGQQVGSSGSGTSAEVVSLAAPQAGTYTVYVHGWGTDGPDAAFRLFTWNVDGDAGNMTASGPDTAVIGETGSVTVSWSGLEPETKYLGVISHNSGVAQPNLTVLGVDVP